MIEYEASYALVPAAYPRLNALLMDRRLTIADQKVRCIPPLVIARKPNAMAGGVIDVLFLHPATQPLVTAHGIRCRQIRHCASNESAALNLLASSRLDAAITNQLAAQASMLHVASTLRPAAPMGWLLLKRSQ